MTHRTRRYRLWIERHEREVVVVAHESRLLDGEGDVTAGPKKGSVYIAIPIHVETLVHLSFYTLACYPLSCKLVCHILKP